MLGRFAPIAVVLLAVTLIFALPALAAHGGAHHYLTHTTGRLLVALALGLGLVGTATINYKYPVSGTTAPTTAQVNPAAGGANSVSAQVVMADADTTAAIVHNFQLTTAQLAQLWPWVIIYPTATGTANATVTVVLTDSITVTVGKAATTGSAATFNVIIARPHSIIT